jgi:hypothetical protein
MSRMAAGGSDTVTEDADMCQPCEHAWLEQVLLPAAVKAIGREAVAAMLKNFKKKDVMRSLESGSFRVTVAMP